MNDSQSWSWLIDRCEAGDQGTRRVPSSDKAEVFWARVHSDDQAVYVKKFLPRSIFDRLKHLAGRVRAQRAAQGSLLLEQHGFSVPQVRHVEIRESRQASFLITAEVSESQTVAAVLSDESLSQADRVGFIRELATMIGRLHDAGLYHGDLQGRNLLYRLVDSQHEFYWLDNERSRSYARIPLTRRMRNLRQLDKIDGAASSWERRVFWRAYIAHAKLDASERRELLRLVLMTRAHRRLGPIKVPDTISWKCFGEDLLR